MITLYNRMSPFNVFRSKARSKTCINNAQDVFSGENSYNLGIEDRLSKDLSDLKKAFRQRAVEKAIIDEFGKEMPLLAAKVLKKLPLEPTTFGLA
ncbi:MAG: hypothetical protein ACD_20C00402G0028 [uncultured bacterium]|nr:MAG: hypothetical protein ACD_20C00402G0028 [uncultured bacterium]